MTAHTSLLVVEATLVVVGHILTQDFVGFHPQEGQSY